MYHHACNRASYCDLSLTAHTIHVHCTGIVMTFCIVCELKNCIEKIGPYFILIILEVKFCIGCVSANARPLANAGIN